MHANYLSHFVTIEIMEEDSSKIKKRKRGRSLIFKSLLPLSGSSHDSAHASDDNLVYCDISNNGPNGEASTKTKSASTRGRMSTIFKAVLFDTAMKKRMRGKKPSKTNSVPPTNPPSVPDNNQNVVKVSETDNNPNVVKVSERDNNSNVVKASEDNNNPNVVKISEKDKNNTNIEKVLETDNNTNVAKVPETDNNPNTLKISEAGSNSSNESLKVVSVPSKTDVPSVASLATDNGSQTPTKKKVMTRVNSNTKKPPLPSSCSRLQAKPTMERDSKPATSNNSTSRLYLLVVLLVILLVVLWMRFRTTVTEPSNLDSDHYTNPVVVGDEL